MTGDLQSLHHQQEQERHSLEQEQRQEQERLLQHQQQTFQEQEQNYHRLQNEYLQDPTPLRAHEIMMLEQEGKHSQELFAQQRQHLLERQQQERLRMQERQWAQERITMQEIQAQRLLQQQHQHQQHQQLHFQSQQQFQHEVQQYPHQQQHQHQDQHQHQHQHQQHHQHQTQETHQIKESDAAEAMDVDDEATLHSIASTITNLRQHNPGHTSSVGAWADGAATQRRSDDNDPDSVVVLDTNILISHLNFFQSLVKSYGAPSVQSSKRRGSINGTVAPSEDVVFIIPWIVMQELDGLKGGGRQGSEVDVSGKARLAVEFLRAELSKPSSTSRLRGQKMSEIVAKAEANDDKILDCCQYFRILYGDPTKTRIILFTNDKNLSVKAMVHEVEVISRFTVQLELSSVRDSISRTKDSSKDDSSAECSTPSNHIGDDVVGQLKYHYH